MINKKGQFQGLLRNPTILITLLVLVGALYFGFAQTGITIGNRPLDKGTFELAGVTGNYETTYLGSINNYNVQFDGRKTGDDTISNTIKTSGNDITLKSTYSVQSDYKSGNYIEAKVLLPEGTIDLSCDISGTFERGLELIDSSCGIKNIKEYRVSFNFRDYAYSINNRTSIVLDKPTEVIFFTSNNRMEVGSTSSSTLKATFTPKPTEQTCTELNTCEVKECNQNSDCEGLSNLCINNKCLEEDGTVIKLNFIDRINLWISNFFDSIFGGRK